MEVAGSIPDMHVGGGIDVVPASRCEWRRTGGAGVDLINIIICYVRVNYCEILYVIEAVLVSNPIELQSFTPISAESFIRLHHQRF